MPRRYIERKDNEVSKAVYSTQPWKYLLFEENMTEKRNLIVLFQMMSILSVYLLDLLLLPIHIFIIFSKICYFTHFNNQHLFCYIRPQWAVISVSKLFFLVGYSSAAISKRADALLLKKLLVLLSFINILWKDRRKLKRSGVKQWFNICQQKMHNSWKINSRCSE